MKNPVPCYRILLWCPVAGRWRPFVTRTRTPIKHLRQLKMIGFARSGVHVERRPGKGVPMPFPPPKGHGVKLHVA